MFEVTKRACIRLPCHIQAEIKFAGGDSEMTKKAVVSNISTTGIQILSPSFVATGQTVTASFKIPGNRKKCYSAEVMRIESLQGRMPGRFPYALGAKFVDFSAQQEKKIAAFIENKMSCRGWRWLLALLLAGLAGIEAMRVLPMSYLNQSESFDFAALRSWQSVFLAALFLTSSLAVFINSKIFPNLCRMALGIGAFLSAVRIIFQLGGFSAEPGWLWLHEAFLFAVQISLIASLTKMLRFFKSMQRVLAEEKISTGTGKPTFTIL